jgi:hypothetical protein
MQIIPACSKFDVHVQNASTSLSHSLGQLRYIKKQTKWGPNMTEMHHLTKSPSSVMGVNMVGVAARACMHGDTASPKKTNEQLKISLSEEEKKQTVNQPTVLNQLSKRSPSCTTRNPVRLHATVAVSTLLDLVGPVYPGPYSSLCVFLLRVGQIVRNISTHSKNEIFKKCIHF